MFILASCLFFFYYKSGRFNNTYAELEEQMEKQYEKHERLDSGRWYSTKWEMYHTLSFESDKNIVLDNHVDTLLRYKYTLRNDTLWLMVKEKTFIPNTIKLHSNEELVFENLLDEKKEVRYSRINNREK